MIKVVIQGILEINHETGTVSFYADPNTHISTQLLILQVTGVPPNTIDINNGTYVVAVDHGPLKQPPSTPLMLATTTPPRLSLPAVVPSLPIISTANNVIPGGFADILYPAKVASIMLDVIGGRWDGPDPERYIDSLLVEFSKGIVDPLQYIKDIMMAVSARKCGDIVAARLNAMIVAPPDTGDTITVKRNRRQRLPYESLAQPSDSDEITPPLPQWSSRQSCELSNIPPIDTSECAPPYTNAEEAARNFYADESVFQMRPPTLNLSDAIKEAVRKRLLDNKYDLTEDVNEAFLRLETILHSRDMEQLIIGRLAFLAILNALDRIDGNAAISMLLPQRLLPSSISMPRRKWLTK